MSASSRSPLRGLALLAGALLLVGCGAGPQAVGESGVDDLTIPTPDPRPEDFVTGVDNPWLALTPGSSWTWERERTGRPRRVVDSVLDTYQRVAGVRATVVERVVTKPGGAVAERTRRYYAQDRAGNVWLFGQQGDGADWLAGVDGAEAGLAMPAAPRLGDGWPVGSAPGVFADVATVLTTSAEVTVPDGTTTDALVLQYSSPLDPVLRDRIAYAQGEGPVEVSSVGATWTLVGHDAG